MKIVELFIQDGFVDLGFAPWESGKGLQVQNLDRLNKESPGVYIMHYDEKIQKIGKASASLFRRLNGYKGYDVPSRMNDKSSQKQRRFIEESGVPGLFVLAKQPDVEICHLNFLGCDFAKFSFDAHDLEKRLIDRFKIDLKHPMGFGS